jgi:hypothetical protein
MKDLIGSTWQKQECFELGITTEEHNAIIEAAVQTAGPGNSAFDAYQNLANEIRDNWTKNIQEKPMGLKVFVVWHRIYEKVISVHFTEAGAQKYMEDFPEALYRLECKDFEVKR